VLKVLNVLAGDGSDSAVTEQRFDVAADTGAVAEECRCRFAGAPLG
jgi:hypothetical protein